MEHKMHRTYGSPITQVEGGYKRGKSNASVFYHRQHDVRVMVHGDDFLALGDQKHLCELEDLLRKSYALKCLGIIGDQPEDKKETHFPEQVDSVWWKWRKTSSMDWTW